MSDAFYVARSQVARVQGAHRRARLEAGPGVDVEFGVHGPVKAHYNLLAEPNLPLPVDYIVAATGG